MESSNQNEKLSLKGEMLSTISKIKNTKITKRKIINLSVIFAAIILLIVIVLNALCLFSPTFIAKKYVTSYMKGNYRTVDQLKLVKDKDVIKAYAKNKELTVKEYLDKYKCESVNELISQNAEDRTDSIEDEYGEYKIKIKKAKKDKYTKSEIKDIKEDLKDDYDSYVDTDKITKAYNIDVKFRIIGEDDKATKDCSLTLVKYKHIWKIVNQSIW